MTKGQQIIYCTTWALVFAKRGDVNDAVFAASRAVDAASRTPEEIDAYANQVERHVLAVLGS